MLTQKTTVTLSHTGPSLHDAMLEAWRTNQIAFNEKANVVEFPYLAPEDWLQETDRKKRRNGPRGSVDRQGPPPTRGRPPGARRSNHDM